MEDRAEVLQEKSMNIGLLRNQASIRLLRVQPSQGAEVVAVDTWLMGVQAALAS